MSCIGQRLKSDGGEVWRTGKNNSHEEGVRSSVEERRYSKRAAYDVFHLWSGGRDE